jgi:Ca2+-binding RTX toxin-like protein
MQTNAIALPSPLQELALPSLSTFSAIPISAAIPAFSRVPTAIASSSRGRSVPQINLLSSYSTGAFAQSGSEIVGFDPSSQRLFVTNSADLTIDILDASDPTNLTKIGAIALSSFGGGVNSVAVKNGIVAVAVQATDVQSPGQVVFFNAAGNFISAVTTGALPDSLTFSPDGSKVIVANEGEPNDDYSVDPQGSVSIIDLSGGITNLTQSNVKIVSFESFDQQTLIDQGVRVFGPNASVAQDLEPEYIAISPDSQTAWVTLQENNALAKINLATGQVEILPLGFKDHSLAGNGFDASDKDGKIDIKPQPVFGIYQPDAIAAYTAAGKTFLVTANEGDARDYGGFSEEARVGDLVLDPIAFPNAAELQKEENLGRLRVTTTLGDTDSDGDYDKLYAFGSRSFSIWDEDGNLVFDSGDDLEQIVAAQLPSEFNSSDEENGSFDSRSDDKGPEPEALAIGEVEGRTLAFIGLERVSGIVVYDITNPNNPQFRQYLNNRDFTVPVTLPDGSTNPAVGDLAPEGFTFISANESPTGRALLAVGNEISGTTTLYDVGTSIEGGNRRDELKGTSRADFIRGGGGDDELDGRDGSDTIFGGDGDDEIQGGDGNNFLYGEGGNDELRTEEGNNTLVGGSGNDKLRGDKGFDILIGVDPTQTAAGRGEIDRLKGKGGDRYVLGDANQVYYNDGLQTTAGFQDYAVIEKFEGRRGDVIQLNGDASKYVLGAGFSSKETGIYLKESVNELIAVVEGKDLSSLTGSSFIYV